MENAFVRSPSGVLVPRRALLRGGLAGFATAMATRLLPGCDSTGTTDGGIDGGGPSDVPRDVFTGDAGPSHFVPREMPARPALVSRIADIGPLGAPNADGVRLPPGFTARILAQEGEPVLPSSYLWHIFPDGGATFATLDGGWIYVSNSEIPRIGGAGAIRFDATGAVTSAYRILEGTSANCAGGPTPWGSWLSCEELSRGQVYECDPHGERLARVRPALGTFKHEAVTVDPGRGHLYLSEDEGDGNFYRYVPAGMNPAGYPDLDAGRLEVASVAGDGSVTWLEVPDPLYTGDVPTRMQVAAATVFRGGEGLWFHDDVVYLSTKGDNRIWAYDAAAQRIDVLYDAEALPMPPLRGVDNLTVSCCGDVLVGEDQGSMQIVAILPDGSLKPLMQVTGQDGSEITGPAFDPSGTRLYFSSQRGGSQGITYVIEGPFHAPA
jgi:secreted PhoX family phosphatase